MVKIKIYAEKRVLHLYENLWKPNRGF